MKSSTISAIALCGALAFAVSGCKYDETETAGAGDVAALDAGALDQTGLATETDPLAGGATGVETVSDGAAVAAPAVDPNAGTMSLSDATGNVPFDQDPSYARCTDVTFDPVYFGFDASAIAQTELAKIEAVAAHLKQQPGRVVMVEGNCDERGSNEYNLSLGELRAISVRDYLTMQGIGPERIQTRSYGEEKPAVQGTGESVWSKNRRGEFAVFQKR